MSRSFRLISLGCAKALVDSEMLAARLQDAGWSITDAEEADLVVVNTCAFIQDATEEAIDTLLQEAERKQTGQVKWLAAVGCLPEKYRDKLAREMPELDLVAGVNDLARLDHLLEQMIARGKRRVAISPHRREYDEQPGRLLSTPFYRGYLKIAEGCSNACAYCIIGRLRGPARSRRPEAIVAEANELVQGGVIELDVIAQDITRYGLDLRPRYLLPELIRRLDGVEGLRWLRLLYAHPAYVDEKLTTAMAGAGKVVPYLDLPLQHVSDRVLKRMNRPQTRAQSERVLKMLRENVPGIALRTTFLVGHPGETEEDFAQVLDFVKTWRFEHLGAFAWSPEIGTPSYEQDDWVTAEIAQERLARLLALQEEISRDLWREWEGREVDVLVEEVLHKHDDQAFTHVGRIAQQAAEVDGVTYLRAPTEQDCAVGQVVRGRIVDADAYELFAELI